jgi:RHS repeat-associated protein
LILHPLSLDHYLKSVPDFDWYDYGARFYDPGLGRFPSLDPLADKFYHLSPYNYASNSPIAMVDLWGLQ